MRITSDSHVSLSMVSVMLEAPRLVWVDKRRHGDCAYKVLYKLVLGKTLVSAIMANYEELQKEGERVSVLACMRAIAASCRERWAAVCVK